MMQALEEYYNCCYRYFCEQDGFTRRDVRQAERVCRLAHISDGELSRVRFAALEHVEASNGKE